MDIAQLSRRSGGRLLATALFAVAAACGDPPPDDRTGVLGIQVAGSGVTVGAQVTIDQMRMDVGTWTVREHIADGVTDAEGRFSVETGILNGVFRVRARGGTYVDLATGQTIELDPTAEMSSLVELDIFEHRDDALVSPIGHLTQVLAQRWLAEGRASNIIAALDEASAHVHGHFGDVDWGRIQLADLDLPAGSATPEVRAALVHAGWSYLAQDIAQAAEASPQEVSVHALMTQLAADLADGPFDGADGNDRALGSGLQVGVCPPVEPACVVPGSGCTRGACRPLCDLYDGTPRVLLAGAIGKVLTERPHLDAAALRPIARAINDNTDVELFGASACVEQLDRLPPTIAWEAPAEGADPLVSGTLLVRVRAFDDGEQRPTVIWDDDLPDIDGDLTNEIAIASIVTTDFADGEFAVTAIARDFAGNVSRSTRWFDADNTAPTLTLASDGFLVRAGPPEVWWTPTSGPELRGTVVDAHSVTVEAEIASVVYEGTVTGTDWRIPLPSGTIPSAGTPVTVRATDAAGNAAPPITKTLRSDVTPPVLTMQDTQVKNELHDIITFRDPGHQGEEGAPWHQHVDTNQTTLGPATNCGGGVAPDVHKYAYLLDQAAPVYGGEGAKNELKWMFGVADDGVGLDPAGTAYQVRQGGQTLVAWRALSDPGPFQTVRLYRRVTTGSAWPAIPQLGTVDGQFQIDFRGRDAFGRETIVTRCWNHKPKAAPVEIGAIGAPTSPGPWYALSSMQLGSGRPIAAQVLNDGAPGTGLAQFTMLNGTNEDIYVALNLTERPGPNTSWSRAYQHSHAMTAQGAQVNCGCETGTGCTGPLNTPECTPRARMPLPATEGRKSDGNTAMYDYTLRVWDTTSSPWVELTPCAECENVDDSGDTPTDRKQFRLPARGTGPTVRPVRTFVALVVVKTIANVRPFSPNDPWPSSGPPYTDFSMTYIQGGISRTATFTGKLHGPTTRRCATEPVLQSNNYVCQNVQTYQQYRALEGAGVTFTPDRLTTAIASSATATLPRRDLSPLQRPADAWTTVQTLPLPIQ
jgi:hypothetical protein